MGTNGFVSNGIVCRQNKLSAESSSDVSGEGLTLETERLHYAKAAIKALRSKFSTIDVQTSSPIFASGHSLRGMLATMVANADPSIRDLLLLSAARGKLYQPALRQAQYLASQETNSPWTPQSY